MCLHAQLVDGVITARCVCRERVLPWPCLAGDLKRLVRRMAEAGRSFDEPEIWLYFSQILDGLRGMHASRILHRDIKPANMLVSKHAGMHGAVEQLQPDQQQATQHAAWNSTWWC
jgi:hypothetical protein